MPETFEDRFNAALLRFIRTDGKPDAERIGSVDMETEEAGGCVTCAYTIAYIEVYYYDSEDRGHYYRYNGDFSSLIRRLSDA